MYSMLVLEERPEISVGWGGERIGFGRVEILQRY